jgi:DNA-binding XRE family transcriptional regulator
MATPRKKPEERLKMGAPTAYRVAYCAAVIASGKRGDSLVQFAASIGVSKRSINEWAEVHPDFSRAVEIAKTLSEAKFEKTYQKHVISGSSAGAASFYGSARFGWSSKTEAKTDVTTNGESLNIPVVLKGA